MAKAKGKPAGKKRRITVGMTTLVLFLSTAIVALFLPSFMLLAAGMIPTGIAYLVDRRPSKHCARTVGWMNLAGCFVVLLRLWNAEHTVVHALELLGDPLNWVIMFGGAAIGWVFYLMLPPMITGYLAIRFNLKRKELVNEQQELVKEWGEDVESKADMETLADVTKQLETVNAQLAAKKKAEEDAEKATAQAASGEEA